MRLFNSISNIKQCLGFTFMGAAGASILGVLYCMALILDLTNNNQAGGTVDQEACDATSQTCVTNNNPEEFTANLTFVASGVVMLVMSGLFLKAASAMGLFQTDQVQQPQFRRQHLQEEDELHELNQHAKYN